MVINEPFVLQWWGLGTHKDYEGRGGCTSLVLIAIYLERTLPHTHHAVEKKISSLKRVSESIWSEDLEADFHIVCLKDCLLLLAIRVFFWNACLIPDLHLLTAATKDDFLFQGGWGPCSSGKVRPCHESRSILSLIKKTNKKLWYFPLGHSCKIYLHFLNLGFLIH